MFGFVSSRFLFFFTETEVVARKAEGGRGAPRAGRAEQPAGAHPLAGRDRRGPAGSSPLVTCAF